ncbi:MULTISPECIES: methylated-DNA--[protein]-cysteine S-methyltransferase [Rossellomorea]|uniref:methylated-DNA--[protein]-cysteine S-methyltransferase n=1 Tax=Rossellomorea TaxID=2837508 RepID=UPI001CCAFBFA|nr:MULTISPECIES: methylated-DNA--[protein]-cysteine S-methyltransferase [Rossellomorea]MCA0148872.1 methylated-DNA--[protein]-cysteine S-methyltransferase [Rossellomorea vietnamensis]UTE79227.1 methylated-DNA--[protein]-cysteine S-methyltransferase [Rossellomorea sp. KS-H15a]WGG47292.1 methylated-DNA--[protein]-cysteine S-methyltransferase [Rossellomorea sp. DA94]
MTIHTIVIDSPIGNLKLTADSTQLLSVQFVEEEASIETDHPILIRAKEQILEFFKGDRRAFDLPLKIEGTEFQKEVWNILKEIPYGETWSYQDVAQAIQRPKAVRAVGQANKANRFPVIIPCHRVIGKNKTLTGYAGKQIDKKETLLSLEQ